MARRALSFLVVTMLALLLTATLLDDPGVHNVLLSSDSLFPAAFVWDVMQHASAWTTFEHSRVPSVFPDLAVYGALQAGLGDWRVAMAAWVLIVMAWLLGLGSMLAARIGRVSTAEAAPWFALLTAAVLVVAMLGFPNPSPRGLDGTGFAFPYLFILVLATHGGPFLLATSTAILALREATRPALRPAGLAVLAAVSWAGGLSDPLCLVSLLAPLCAALAGGGLVRAVTWRNAAVVAGVVCVAAAAGWGCTLLINRQPLPPVNLRLMLANLVRFTGDIGTRPGMVMAGVMLLVPLAVLLRSRGVAAVQAMVWPVFGLVAAAGSLALTMVMYDGIWTYRYALPFLWWPLILIAGVGAGLLRRGAAVPALLAAAAAGVLGTAYVAKGWHAPTLLAWRSELASCLLHNELRTGLGDYWTARKTSAASDWQLHIEQITPQGEAFLWVNDRTWYAVDIHDRRQAAAFSFIVLDRLDKAQIRRVYGEPNGVLTCAGSEVWTYDDAPRVKAALARVSPRLGRKGR